MGGKLGQHRLGAFKLADISGVSDFILLDPIYTGHIGDVLLGIIDGREQGHISDTVAGTVEEDVEE